jgi:hypothetical protein
MATSSNPLMPIGAGSLTQALVGTADVSDELGRAGMSLGKFVEFTGKAVADTQLRLNQTGAAMASTLATTKVDVIAVQESVYDDDGRLDESVSYTRQLPLINFIDPVFYEWTAVRLQGFFFARELVASNESRTGESGRSTGIYGSGISFVLGPGALIANRGSQSTSADVDTTQDTSFGNIRASALLEPKRDIGVPPPRQVVRGPSLGVVAGDIQDVMNGAVLAGRTMSVLLQLRRSDGSGIEGKAISIDSEGAPWSFTDPALITTDAAGDLRITLRRDFVGDSPDTSPADIVLTARLGLVSNSETLTF